MPGHRVWLRVVVGYYGGIDCGFRWVCLGGRSRDTVPHGHHGEG